MPLCLQVRFLCAGLIALNAVSCSQVAMAIGGADPIHHNADRTFWDRKKNSVRLIGHATVHQPRETIQADEILLDLEDRLLDAKGNVVYTATDSVIYADEMHFHLDTRAGTIIGGRVLNSQFTLQGERINKLGDGRFQTHWGEYTTCRDCPGSWSLLAEDVDIIFGGYGFFRNMTLQIRDTPAVWVPYLLIPIKTKRQSGLLFPRFSFSGQAGFMAVQPFFWAPHRSFDLTLAAGAYSARGFRGELETRYALGSLSTGEVQFNYLNDNSVRVLSPHRWTLNVSQSQRLPFGFLQKFKVTEWSDNLYPYIGAPDGSVNDMTLKSSLSLTHTSPFGGAYVAFLRHRNLLNTDPEMSVAERQWKFDRRTVQSYPRFELSSNDWLLFGAPVAVGLTGTLDNFTREAADFDTYNAATGTAFRAGIDPLRRARRFSLFPRIYTSVRPWDIFALVPSIEYRLFYYDFAPTAAPLLRAYPVLQLDFYAQIERIFDRPGSASPRLKHLIRPQITYSLIPHPLITEDTSHPFMQQIGTTGAASVSGFNFDNRDIVPITTSPGVRNYFVPIGHSMAYGARSQWIFRTNSVDALDGSYSRLLELYFNHALNFLDPQSIWFTRFNSGFDFAYGNLSVGGTYAYTPPVTSSPFHSVSFSVNYVLERTVRQRILEFNRSFGLFFVNDGSSNARNIGLNATFSITDSIMPSASVVYDLTGFTFQGLRAGLVFQSISRCWRLGVSASYSPAGGFVGPEVGLTMNLTGSGFSGLEGAASQFVSR